MADEKEFVLTREGKLELENELDTLKKLPNCFDSLFNFLYRIKT